MRQSLLGTGVRFFMAAQLRRNPFIGWFFMAAFQTRVDYLNRNFDWCTWLNRVVIRG